MWIDSTITKLRDVYSEEPWYGKPVRTILTEIDPSQASVAPSSGEHSLYQLAKHMLAWRTFVLERLKGNDAYKVDVNSEADWMKERATTASDWKLLLKAFDQNQQELLSVLARADEELLNKQVSGKPYSFRKLVEGIIDHDIYHAGQLVSTAKAIGAYRPAN